jgi:type IV secretory pathway VirJ component
MIRLVPALLAYVAIACQPTGGEEPRASAPVHAQAPAAAPDPAPAPATEPKPLSPKTVPPLLPADNVSDLPLVVMRAKGRASDVLVVVITGDGGWAGLDLQLGGHLATHGMDVVGLLTPKYFWDKKTPEGTAADVARIARHFAAAWGKSSVLLVGYSRGAEIMPFVANRLPPDVSARVCAVAILGPAHGTEFEFHMVDLVRDPPPDGLTPVLPEVERLRGKPLLCVYGTEEPDTLCKDLDPGLARVVALKGGHHFGGHYRTIADLILEMIRPSPAAQQ